MPGFPPKRETSGPISGTLQLEAMVVRVEQDSNTNTDNLTLMFLEPFGVDGVAQGTRNVGDKVLLEFKFVLGSSVDVI